MPDIPAIPTIDTKAIMEALSQLAQNPYVLGAGIVVVIMVAFIFMTWYGHKNRQMVSRYGR